MPTLPEIRIPMPEEENKTLYGYITNSGEPPKFDDIRNSNLSPEEKVKQAQYRTQAYQDDLDRQLNKDLTRMKAGTALSAVSFHPFFNIPYVGTGIGGAMYDLGQGIVEGDTAGDLAKRAGRGFVIGETIGAIPYVGKALGKTKAGQAVINSAPVQAVGNVLNKAGEKFTNSKLYDALMTDIKAFNPNKQTVYHGSPYDFNKFSNEAIGTGEGAQAHGYGHYTALDKDVAEGYRRRLSESLHNEKIQSRLSSDLKNDRIQQLKDNEEKELFEYIANNITPSEFNAEHLKNYFFKDLESPEAKDFAKNLLENMAENNNIKTGQLYKLSVPKDDVMLREDVKFSQQPKKVQDALEKYFKDLVELNEGGYQAGKTLVTPGSEEQLLRDYIYNNGDGSTLGIYRGLADKKKTFHELHKDPINSNYAQQQITNDLSDYGIKGISYNGGIDGEAVVIFNPDDIVIGRKYYNQPNLYEQLTGKQNTGASSSSLYDYLSNAKANQQYEQELQKLYNPPNNIDPNTIRAYIGDVSDDAYNLGLQNGYDLTGFQHMLDNSGFNHFRNNHFGINEIDDRLIPLSDDDIRNIPNVIYSPDTIEFLPKTVRKLPRIKYTKNTDNGKQIYVEQIQNKKKRLNTKTMWKEK